MITLIHINDEPTKKIENPITNPYKSLKLRLEVYALTLGGFGLHKFYLKKYFQGILYLAFSWTLVPFIIAIIEGISYSRMSDEEFKKYILKIEPN